MNTLKKYLGIVWMALGLVVAWFAISSFGLPKLLSDKADDQIFGGIILFVLTPIITGGLIIFGKYALENAYDQDLD
jgi:hypothetical protein